MSLLITLLVLVASTAAVMVAINKPRLLTEAERTRIENQAILRAEQARLEREKLEAAMAASCDETLQEDGVTTVVFEVIGRGRRSNGEGLEILGKGWLGAGKGAPFCYFPVLYRDGEAVDPDGSKSLMWAKLYDSVSAELLAELQEMDLPVQVRLTGRLAPIRGKGGAPHKAEDGTRHTNWRMSLTEAPVVLRSGDPDWVPLIASRYLGSQAIELLAPHRKPGREVIGRREVEDLMDLWFSSKESVALAVAGAHVVIPAPDEASEPSFGCTPELD